MLPPPSLSKEDIKTMADVRRHIWTSAAWGMGTGSAIGGTLHAAAAWGNRRNLWKVATGRNTLVASVILGGAIGSFLMATTAGKNEVHELRPIYGRGSVQRSVSGGTDDSASYQESLQRAKRRESDLRTLQRNRSFSNRVALPISEEVDEASLERVQRERNRLFRRASLSHQLEGTGGGLSDSHGGRWVK
jgi:hypothetical protein